MNVCVDLEASRPRRPLPLCCLMLALGPILGWTGCSAAGETASDTTHLQAPAVTQVPGVAEPGETDSPSQTPSAEPASPNDAAADQAAAYEPPFPDRTELFVVPQHQENRRITVDGQAEESVKLVGFVDVDGPRVVLSINGLILTIAEGTTHNGLEVISIQRSAVVLQRGRERWQASLEN